MAIHSVNGSSKTKWPVPQTLGVAQATRALGSTSTCTKSPSCAAARRLRNCATGLTSKRPTRSAGTNKASLAQPAAPSRKAKQNTQKIAWRNILNIFPQKRNLRELKSPDKVLDG